MTSELIPEKNNGEIESSDNELMDKEEKDISEKPQEDTEKIENIAENEVSDLPVANVVGMVNTPTAVYVEASKDFSKKEIIMSLVTFVLGFLFMHLLIKHTAGYFTTVLFIVTLIAGSCYMKKKRHKFSSLHIAIFFVLILFSGVYSITSNHFVKGLNTAFLVVGITYLFYLLGDGQNKIGRFLPFEIIKSTIEYPFINFSKQMRAIGSATKKTRSGAIIRTVVIGLLLAVPITCVVGALLMSADSGVEKFMVNIINSLSLENIFILGFELLFSIPIGCCMFSTIYTNTHVEERRKLVEQECEVQLDKCRKIQNAILYITITPICLLYVVFFISQISYFTSAFLGNLPDHYSYSAYARKGFFELLAIEIINIMVIAFINIFAKKSGKKKPITLKIYSVVISFFTMVIIATAISKMVMYINAYGLTQLRVYTTWFMILTAIIFVLIVIKQFKFNLKFTKWVTGVFAVMFLVLCFSRPDAIISRYNLTYHSSDMDRNDIYEMINMSDDSAAVVLEPQYAYLFEGDSRAFYLKEFMSEYKKDPYKSFNISAYKISREFYRME
ncbi:MAG: DUF4173 domain-containing protein [Clostridiales bacterium]|nr:DUF4173 domain-containing protein [Clostridiales bacterium]